MGTVLAVLAALAVFNRSCTLVTEVDLTWVAIAIPLNAGYESLHYPRSKHPQRSKNSGGAGLCCDGKRLDVEPVAMPIHANITPTMS